MKSWEKETKIRVAIGAAMILAAVAMGFALKGFTGPESLMWQRMVFIAAVLGVGLSGFFGMLTPAGFLLGFLPVLAALPRALPEPWNRYFSFVFLGALFALPALKKRKSVKSKKEEPEPLEEPLTQEEEVSLAQLQELTVVLEPLSGRIYQILRCGSQLRFYRAGGELRGVDFEKLQKAGDRLRPLDKKDFTLERSEIRSVKILENENSIYKVTAVVKAGAKKLRLSPVALSPDDLESNYDRFRKFWTSVAPDAIHPQNTGSLAQEENAPNQSRLQILEKIRMVLYGYLLLVGLAWMFLDVPYGLFAVLALLGLPAALVLYILFPNEITLDENKKTDPKVSLTMAVMLGGTAPALRALLDYNIQTFGRYALLSLAVAAVGVALVMLLNREWKRKKGVILALAMGLLFYGFGFVGQVNGLLDTNPPRQEVGVIVDMDISTSSKGPDSYHLTIVMPDGEELDTKVSRSQYESMEIGDSVTVYTYPGFLGIPYTFAVETE